MLPDSAKYQALSLSIILISIFFLFRLAGSTQSEYKETISVLQTRHQDEMQAMHKYQAYAQNAVSQKYPQFIDQIKPENHIAAIQYITYAWESEKQHRELLKKIQSGMGAFFGLLIKRIEGNPYQYFFCQNCGSTLTEIPASVCPVCGEPPAKYKEIIFDFDDEVAG